jgi:flagellar basal body-associated protein FliL
MKKLAAILFLALAAFGVYWFFIRSKSSGDSGPKQEALKVGKHSAAFNDTVTNMLTAYLDMKAAFVEADSTAAKAACRKMLAVTDSFKLADLQKDTTDILATAADHLMNIRANAQSLLTQTDITEMRQDFRMVSESIYPFLKTIKHEGKKLYWQSCPMAFGDKKEGNWISNTSEVVNPYLGKNHPEFKATMLHCGEVKDSLQ